MRAASIDDYEVDVDVLTGEVLGIHWSDADSTAARLRR